MASLAWYQNKFGKRQGRKRYNAYHLAYRMTHRNRQREYWKAYRSGTPKSGESVEVAKTRRMKHLFAVRGRRIKQRGLGGSHTPQQWQDLLKQFEFACARCGRKQPEVQLVRDHIIPISIWVKFWGPWIVNGWLPFQCNDIDNIQPLCSSCNNEKSDKLTTGETFTALRALL
jgi:5-methylcytosine-specific restriction endonuclease McrA